MKKLYYLYFGLAAIAVMVFIACERDHILGGGKDEGNRFTVEEAKAFFEGHESELEIRPLTTNPDTRNEVPVVITPQWAKGREYRDGPDEYVDVPFGLPIQKIFRVKKGEPPIPEEETYPNTDVRLLAQRTEDGDYNYSVVHVTGDFDYIVRGLRHIERLHLDDLSKFSGEIRYFSLSGELLRGFIYKKGKRTHSISADDRISSANGSESAESGGGPATRGYVQSCYWEDVKYSYTVCVGFPGESGGGQMCRTHTYWDTEWICDNVWEDEGSGGGEDEEDEEDEKPGGGGGGGGVNIVPIKLDPVVITANAPILASYLNLISVKATLAELRIIEQWIRTTLEGKPERNDGPNDKKGNPNCALTYLFNSLLKNANISLNIEDAYTYTGDEIGTFNWNTNTVTTAGYGEGGPSLNLTIHEFLHAAEKKANLSSTNSVSGEFEVRMIVNFIELKFFNDYTKTMPVLEPDRRGYERALADAVRANDISKLKDIRDEFISSAETLLVGQGYTRYDPGRADMALVDYLVEHGCN